MVIYFSHQEKTNVRGQLTRGGGVLMYELTSGTFDENNPARALLSSLIIAGALHSLSGIDH